MPDCYVALVKEYLELQDFLVRTEVQYQRHRNTGDIDILAVRIKDGQVAELAVGEVKSEYKTPQEIDDINRDKFENEYVKTKLKQLYGPTKPKKYLYVWSFNSEQKEYAKQLEVTLVSFKQIVDFMWQNLEEIVGKASKKWLYIRDYPNLMLLQFLKDKFVLEERDDKRGWY